MNPTLRREGAVTFRLVSSPIQLLSKTAAHPDVTDETDVTLQVKMGITHWNGALTRSTGGVCRMHALKLFEDDPTTFQHDYKMRHGKPCEG
jgi:hypothetical protein